MRRVVLIVHGDAGDLTPNRVARMHWAEIGRRQKEWKNRAHWTWLSLNALPFAPGTKVRVSATVYRWRRMDEDNCQKSLALKSILDGIVAAKGLKDDGPRYCIGGPVAVEFGSREPRVELTLEEVANED